MQSRPNEALMGMKNHSTIMQINIVNSLKSFFKNNHTRGFDFENILLYQ